MSFYGNRVPRGWVREIPPINHSPLPPSLQPGASELLGIREPEPEEIEVHEDLEGFSAEEDTEEAIAQELMDLSLEKIQPPAPPTPPVLSEEDLELLSVVSEETSETEGSDSEEESTHGPEVLVARPSKKRGGRPKKNP